MPELALSDEEEFVRGNSSWQHGHLVFHKSTMTVSLTLTFLKPAIGWLPPDLTLLTWSR